MMGDRSYGETGFLGRIFAFVAKIVIETRFLGDVDPYNIHCAEKFSSVR